MSTSVKKRNANIELLRIISILMVTVLHATVRSGAIADYFIMENVNNLIAEGFFSFSVAAVNIFMLISGYFLIQASFKLSRLFELVLQTVFYTVLSFAVCLGIGLLSHQSVDIYYILKTVLPIHMNVYWFVSVYIALYTLSPLISAGVNAISRNQFKAMLIILVIYESVFKSVLPVNLAIDEGGRDFLWCLTVFLIGAYIRLYGINFLNSVSKGLILYFISSLLIFTERIALCKIGVTLGHLGVRDLVSHDYNHIFVLAASIGIFTAFLQKKEITGVKEKIILFLSPMTLGVYLILENLPLRDEWTEFTGIINSACVGVLSFVLHLIFGCIVMFVVGSFVDYLRIALFNFVKKKVSHK